MQIFHVSDYALILTDWLVNKQFEFKPCVVVLCTKVYNIMIR